MAWARRCASQIIALVAILVAPVASAGQSAFDGVYIASGVDAENREYRRAVDIEQHGDRFIVTWISARIVGEALVLEPTWVGVGIATGETLSVSFIAEDSVGIVVYQVAPDGQGLSGRWSVVGDDEAIHSETLERLPDTLPEPTTTDPPEYQPPSSHSHLRQYGRLADGFSRPTR